ncbi:hypothetical protein NUACC26_031510 [Scytonema sp. NUACC26]
MRINNQNSTTYGGNEGELEPFIELNNHLKVLFFLVDGVKYKSLC